MSENLKFVMEIIENIKRLLFHCLLRLGLHYGVEFNNITSERDTLATDVIPKLITSC